MLTYQADKKGKDGKTVELYKRDNGDWVVVDAAKRFVNLFQSLKINMEVDAKVALQYDLEHQEMYFNITRDATGKEHVKAYIYIPKQPDVIITHSKATVLDKSSERLQVQDFNNVEQKLYEEIKKTIIEDAKRDKIFYEGGQKVAVAQFKKNAETYLNVGIDRTVEVIVDVEERTHTVDENGNIVPILMPPARPN